jgi:hypothetical protein
VVVVEAQAGLVEQLAQQLQAQVALVQLLQLLAQV